VLPILELVNGGSLRPLIALIVPTMLLLTQRVSLRVIVSFISLEDKIRLVGLPKLALELFVVARVLLGVQGPIYFWLVLL